MNTRADGDQGVQTGRAVAATHDGRGIIAFTSISDTDALRADVRVVRFSAEAQPLRTCGEPGDRTIATGAPGGPPIFYGNASIVSSPDSTLPIIVSYAEDRPDGDRLWLDALDPESACGFFDDTLPDLFPLQLADAPGRILSQAVGAWLGGEVFAFAWIEVEDDLMASTVFARAMSINAGGVLEQDLVDARTGERTSTRAVPLTEAGSQTTGFDLLSVENRLLLVRFVAVGDQREVRVSIHREDFSVIVPAFAVSDRFRDAPTPQVALAYDGTQVLVAWSQSAAEGSGQIFGRMLTPDGDFLSSSIAPDGAPFRLGTSEGISEQAPVAIAMPGGGFLAAWSTVAADGGTQSVRASILGPDGDRVFANRSCGRSDFELPGEAAGEQGRVSLVRLGESVVAAWNDAGGNGSDSDGFAVRAAVYEPRSLLPLR